MWTENSSAIKDRSNISDQVRELLGLLLFVSALVPAMPGMTAVADVPSGHCRVVDGAKLGGTVTAGAICAAVELAIDSAAPKARYGAEIRVISPSRLAATVTVNGRVLPVQNFAVMDRNLSDGSIKHFADSLAAAVAEAVKA